MIYHKDGKSYERNMNFVKDLTILTNFSVATVKVMNKVWTKLNEWTKENGKSYEQNVNGLKDLTKKNGESYEQNVNL